MNEIDEAVKRIAGRHPECFMSLLFGREHTVKLQGVEDAHIQIPEHRLELKSLGAIVAARAFSEELIKQYLTLELSMIRETTIFSNWLDQAEAKGRVEVRVEGYTDGEIKGRHLTLQKLLERKFGPLSAELTISLTRLRSEDLEALTMAILDLQLLEELRALLQSFQSENSTRSLKH